MKTHVRLIVLTLLALAAAAMTVMTTGAFAAAPPAPPAAPEDPALKKQLENLDARANKTKDFTADFKQEKFTALLKKPLVSTGVVKVAGTIIRWDTAKPEPAVLFSDGKEVRMYYPDQKLEEVYPIDQRVGDLASSPLPKLAKLREHFAFARADDVKTFHPPKGRDVLPLKLTPTDDALRKHVDRVNVLLDVKAAHILELEIIDADGDRTHVTFSAFKLDTGIKPEELALKVPADTTVSRPLDVKGNDSESPKQ